MKTIGFVTSTTSPGITSDDELIVRELQTRNAKVEAAPWDSDQIDWKAYDAIVFRSCWNYHHKPAEFNSWLEEMKQQQITSFNSLETIQWNLHKQYLFELEAKGVDIPPAVLVRKNNPVDLNEVMQQYGWSKIVVKPAISATAKGTWVTSQSSMNGAQQNFDEGVSHSDMIIQQFRDEVTQQGEVSLIFVNKKFSHAVLKKPKANDFRVQNDFGGTAETFTPEEGLILQGKKVVEAVNEPLLYARVDGLISNEKFLLMELELIEPVLFLSHSPESAKTIALEIIKRME